MQGSEQETLKLLHQRYLIEAKKFTEALQDNTTQKELLNIRRNVRALLQEIRSYIRPAGSSSSQL